MRRVGSGYPRGYIRYVSGILGWQRRQYILRWHGHRYGDRLDFRARASVRPVRASSHPHTSTLDAAWSGASGLFHAAFVGSATSAPIKFAMDVIVRALLLVNPCLALILPQCQGFTGQLEAGTGTIVNSRATLATFARQPCQVPAVFAKACGQVLQGLAAARIRIMGTLSHQAMCFDVIQRPAFLLAVGARFRRSRRGRSGSRQLCRRLCRRLRRHESRHLHWNISRLRRRHMCRHGRRNVRRLRSGHLCRYIARLGSRYFRRYIRD